MLKSTIRVSLFFVLAVQLSCRSKEGSFVCPPCDLQCDALLFEKEGICPHCNMKLIMKVESTAINAISLKEGSGNFLIEGGAGHTEKMIQVFYHRPRTFNQHSKVLMVLPGAGRNGDTYRDAWVAASEEHDVLVLSLHYSEAHYPRFWNYNLAGMLTDVKINAERTAITDFRVVSNPKDWIYDDFDRIFHLVKNEFHLKNDSYDLFGHSAGGQLAHRFAIFKPMSKANRILASNAGWYTVPDATENFPTGLKNSCRSLADVDFGTGLVLFLGEQDDADETRGDLRHNQALDKQGLHRLERGRYFYEVAKRAAKVSASEFHWKLEMVPNVGHDYKKMSKAAARYLYANK